MKLKRVLILIFATSFLTIGIYRFKLSRVLLTDSTTVAIQPFEFTDTEIMDSIAFHLTNNYGFRVIILPSVDLPQKAFVQVKSPRYRADILLKHLQEIIPDSVDYILGLTSKDISTTKRDDLGRIKKPESKYKDWGIFGLGYRPGNACVVSSFRLTSNRTKTINRLIKVCNHEIGHNLGLKHCTEGKNCVMDDANETIKTVDNGSSTLCDACYSKIH